jgi:stage IV sporulation protein B
MNDSRGFVQAICAFMVVTLVVLFAQLPLGLINDMPQTLSLSYDDIHNIYHHNLSYDYDIAAPASIGAPAKGYATVKAFGAFPIRRIKVEVASERKVYKGGHALGIMLSSDGVLVVKSGVQGKDKSADMLKKGDLIVNINNKAITQVQDIADVLKEHKDAGPVSINIIRQGKPHTLSMTPALDTLVGEYKLGVWVKDKVAGLGTTSYIRLDGRYGALGHPVMDSDTGSMFVSSRGDVYNARIIGVDKGVSGKPGALKGVFSVADHKIGNVHANSKYGVFGDMHQYDNQEQILPVASRLSVRPGKAKLISTVGDTRGEYDIEIVKVMSQKKMSDKSMVVRIIDKDLLSKTGGIVQGMSGSPIVQDNKVVGALTHVFVNDPTRGYGIYLDWMIEH